MKSNKLTILRIAGLLLAAIGVISFITSSMGTTTFILVISGSILLIAAFTASIFAETVNVEERVVKLEDLPSFIMTKSNKKKKPCKTVKGGSDFDVDTKVNKPKRKYKKRAPRRKKPTVKNT